MLKRLFLETDIGKELLVYIYYIIDRMLGTLGIKARSCFWGLALHVWLSFVCYLIAVVSL